MNIWGIFPDLALVEYCTKWIRINRGPGVGLFHLYVFWNNLTMPTHADCIRVCLDKIGLKMSMKEFSFSLDCKFVCPFFACFRQGLMFIFLAGYSCDDVKMKALILALREYWGYIFMRAALEPPCIVRFFFYAHSEWKTGKEISFFGREWNALLIL